MRVLWCYLCSKQKHNDTLTMKTHSKIIVPVIAMAEMSMPIDAKAEVSHFTISELTRSVTAQRLGIENTPTADVVANMQRLIDVVLDPARRRLGKPIFVNSGYRCPVLNKAVGGVERSYHLHGRAADLTTGTVEGNRDLWKILQSLPHSELIWEQGGLWIHVAL